MAGNHYSRSVAALEQTLEGKMQQLSILQEQNHVLRKREAALLAASSSISGGLEATRSVLCPSTSTPGVVSCDTAMSGSSGSPSALQQTVTQSCPSQSCGGIVDSHGCLVRLAEKEAEVQKVLHSMGCTEPYGELYSTQLLFRAVQGPQRAAAHLGRSLTQRLQYISHVVQRFGVLLPKYDLIHRLATSVGSAKQQLDDLVDDLSERMLICGLLDQPSLHMQENMINMDTGMPENYPPGHWEVVIQAMQLTCDQKSALKVCWDRLKPLSCTLTQQHEKLAAHLAQLQKKQHKRQRNFEQQAQTVYAGHNEGALLERHARLQRQLLEDTLHRELTAAAEVSCQSDVQQQLPHLPSMDCQWQQQFEQQLEADMLSQLQQRQRSQDRQPLQQPQQQGLPINQDLSYAPVSAADIDAAAVAILHGDIWQPQTVSTQQQQQRQQQQRVSKTAPHAGLVSPHFLDSAAQQAVSLSDGFCFGSRTAAAANGSQSNMLQLQQAGSGPIVPAAWQLLGSVTTSASTAAATSPCDSIMLLGSWNMTQLQQALLAQSAGSLSAAQQQQVQKVLARACNRAADEEDVHGEQLRSLSRSSGTGINPRAAAAAAVTSRQAPTCPNSVSPYFADVDASARSLSMATAPELGMKTVSAVRTGSHGAASLSWSSDVAALLYEKPQQQLPQLQLQQRIAASDVVLSDDQEPVAAVHNMLARCTTAGQGDILVQLCNRDQQQVEHDLDKATAQLKMLHHCMVLHIHNTLTKKQIALAYLNCYPFVPEAFSFCEALDDMGW